MSTDTRFKPGLSGNPKGRPRASVQLARMIREKTEDGAELVRRVLAIARGEDSAADDAKSIRWALDWLADRTFGRPQQTIEVINGEDREIDWSVLTPEETAIYERLTAKLLLSARIDGSAELH